MFRKKVPPRVTNWITTRQKIVDYVRQNPGATTWDITQHLNTVTVQTVAEYVMRLARKDVLRFEKDADTRTRVGYKYRFYATGRKCQ